MSQIPALPSHVKAIHEIKDESACKGKKRKEKHLRSCHSRDWDVTHRLDLSGVSFPVMAPSLGLKRLSGNAGMHAHIHTQHKAWQWITLAFPAIWRDWEHTPLQEKIILQCPERTDKIILNKTRIHEFNILCRLLETFYHHHHEARTVSAHKHLWKFTTSLKTDENMKLWTSHWPHWCIFCYWPVEGRKSYKNLSVTNL